MQNQPVTQKHLQEITEKNVREINPHKVVLFDSHSRDTDRPDSDLSFLIVDNGTFNAQHSCHVEMMQTNSDRHV